ncbi:MAG: bifunctional non-ous end joining protein LigD [Chthoniobacter sp.]|jgi:bifunctional non-homologous end joining protein LigD|nr:bifunctional non-ous end joining protein LigD [Chthoniobacter sp.]
MSLREYVRKRDFARTREPRGKAGRKASKAARFVIQKHAASRLHYDFRLELGGTLKSWAVPKGIPFVKGDKRLAVQVEDHPVEYADFEGIIPEGQYGGGTVMVWDFGTYEPFGTNPAKDLAAGKLHFQLHGQKLEGEWTLVRIKGEDDRQWLLLKSGESVKPLSKKRDDESAQSGRRMTQITSARDAEWQSNRDADEELPKLKFIEPMMAKLAAKPPTAGDWSYELKFDGYRALAMKTGAQVQLWSRNEKDFAGRYPEIAEAVAALSVRSAILDGEIVALDDAGRPSFELLQALETGVARPTLAYYLFDVLQADGEELLSQPLSRRRERLQRIIQGVSDPIRLSADLGADAHRLLAEVRARQLEGIIGKLRNSKYEPGRRSGAWIKLKCHNEQEFVIGGYTPPEGTRKHLGALLVGYFEGKSLRFAGKVGTGFDTAMLKTLKKNLDALHRPSCPFADLPEKRGGRWTQNITPREMKLCHWVEPQLVAQVRFTEWTRDGKLRHPVFVGLRPDKDAAEVVREQPA